MKVGQDVHNGGLSGLWLRQALLAASETPEWEMVVLTVDTGASDIVVPPHVARNLPLLHSSKVGIEFEVANGGVVANLGDRRATVKTNMDSEALFIVSI